MLKESPELADVRTEILRGLPSVTAYCTALSCPRPAQKNEGSAKLIIHLNVLHACCQAVQLVVSEQQRPPGCYSMILYEYIYLTVIGLTPGGSSIAHIYTQTMHRIQRTECTQQSKKLNLHSN
jgi:hypothetical protein